MLGSEIDAAPTGSREERLVVLGRHSAASSAASSRIRPAMHNALVDTANLRDGDGASAQGDDLGRRFHAQGLRDSKDFRQAVLSIFATDFLRAGDNLPGMAEEIHDGRWLTNQLVTHKRRGATGAGLAKALGKHESVISRYKASTTGFKPGPDRVMTEYFAAFADREDVQGDIRPVTVGRQRGIAGDIDVRGTAMGTLPDSFRFEGGVVDNVKRPPGLQNSREVYAIEVVGTSMVPEHNPGDLRLVDPRRHPKPGESVLVHARWSPEKPAQWFIGRFVSNDAKGVVIRKHSPKDTLVTFAQQYVEAVHKVLTQNEMLR